MRRGNVVGEVVLFVLSLRGVVPCEYRSRRWGVRDIRRQERGRHDGREGHEGEERGRVLPGRTTSSGRPCGGGLGGGGEEVGYRKTVREVRVAAGCAAVEQGRPVGEDVDGG